MIAFSIQASAPPFPSFVIAYTINGFGASLGDAQANGFVANYKDNAATKMGILHAAYGKGYSSSVLLTPTLFMWLIVYHWHRRRSFGSSPRCDTVCPTS
jgi:MFS family permease